MNKELEEVRAKVIKAVPEIGKHYCGSVYCGIKSRCFEESSRPITLADVLRAIGEDPFPTNHYDLRMVGTALSFHGEWKDSNFYNAHWNLALSLDDQEPEVIAFLHKILCV